ncbi:MAG: hypothetical protein GXY84_09640 [Clostridiales bacterium]|nr:hypothetical protein [Clostridiales bacterium]
MLRTLVAIQLRGVLGSLVGRLGRGRRNKPANKVLVGLLVVYVLGALGFSLGTYLLGMFKSFAPLGLTWLYYALAGLSAFVFSFIGSVFLAQSTLFGARDNELLLSLPIPPGLILLSRTAALYLITLLIQALVLLPTMIVHLVAGQVDGTGLALFLLAGLLLPLPTLALSMLLGWGLALISSRLRRKNLVIILLSFLFLAAYLYGYSRLMGAMQTLIARGQEIALALRQVLPPAYHFGQAAAYGKLGSWLLFALACLLPFGLVMWLVAWRYLQVLTTQRGAPRVLYRGGGMKAGGLMKALVQKEARRFFASPVYLMNSAITLLLMLALPVWLLLDRSILALLPQMGLEASWVGALMVLAQSALAGSVFISAPSISLEGKALWIIQSLPVKPIQALMAKALAHLFISLPPILLSGLGLTILLRLDLASALFLLVMPVLANAFTALLGVALNLRFPKLDWRSEMEPVKQSMSTFLTMTIGFVNIGALGALYAFWLRRHLAIQAYLLLCAAFLALLCLLLYRHLRGTAPGALLDLSEA